MNRIRKTEDGFTIIELLIYVGVLAAFGLFLANQFGNVFTGTNLERAYAEIEKVRLASNAYRSSPRHQGLYTNITVTVLAEQGYNVLPFTTGENENTYGLTVAVVSAAGDADATLTYITDEPAACQQLVNRYTNIAGVKGDPACAGNTLTLTLE